MGFGEFGSISNHTLNRKLVTKWKCEPIRQSLDKLGSSECLTNWGNLSSLRSQNDKSGTSPKNGKHTEKTPLKGNIPFIKRCKKFNKQRGNYQSSIRKCKQFSIPYKTKNLRKITKKKITILVVESLPEWYFKHDQTNHE